MKSIFIVLLSTIAVAFGDGVLQLGDSDFSNKLADIETALVMFYAPWCDYCKKLQPKFDNAAPMLLTNDPPVHLVKVDCTENGKESCSKYGVSGYPTLKIFKNGELSSDYNGAREFSTDSIVRFMMGHVGPASKNITSLGEMKKFLTKIEVGVVYFGEGSLKDAFMEIADKMRETVRFGHSSVSAVKDIFGQDTIILFRPSIMANEFENSSVKYDGPVNKDDIETFIKKNFHGLVGQRNQDMVHYFSSPLVVAYYNLKYIENLKGIIYWRNQILKVAHSFKDDFSFAISSKDDFQHELNDYGIDFITKNKPVICTRDANNQKFIMKEDFSMETFKNFMNQLKTGKLKAYLKSEKVPDNEGNNVKVAVAKNFDELVTNSGRDALIQFYAPWCEHCKKLAPIYDELGEMMADEDVDIIKMDATANDVPQNYIVRGFPTFYWKPNSGTPISYNGGRELNDFIKYIAKEANNELESVYREGERYKIEL